MLELIQSLNAGVALILVLLVLINPKGHNTRGNRFLGLFMLTVFVQMFDELIRKQGIYTDFPNLGAISLSFLLSMPVFLFLGILFYVKPNKTYQWSDCKYFGVLILYHLVSLCYLVTNGSFSFYNRDIDGGIIANFYTILLVLFIFQIPLFGFWGYKLLQQHKVNVANYSAANEEVDLGWLNNFNYLYLAMIIMFVVTNLILSDWMLILANLTFLIGLLLMATNTLKQQEVFPVNQEEKKEIQLYLEQKSDAEPLVDQTLSDTLVEQKEALLNLMENTKPHLDNDINLSKLATTLDTSTHQLSATLNNAIGLNFSNFINSYRIEEAKSILLDPKKAHYTMVQVAYEAGYNSKTVFNTHFKKTLSISPTTFKKENLHVITA